MKLKHGFHLLAVVILFFPLDQISHANAIEKVEDCCQFFALGRQGYGNDHAANIANSMNNLAIKRNDIDFVIKLGDNFYPKGITSTQDPQWQEKFENLYKGEGLKQLPFYIIAGNHDHQGNIQAQLKYAEKQKGSARWKMDGLYYTKDFGEISGKPLMRVVFLDSVYLHGLGTASRIKRRNRTYQQQISLLKDAFINNEKKAHWNVVVSHYPVRTETNSKYSQRRGMGYLAPILSELKVDLFLSANDRFQQIIKIDNEPVYVATNGGGEKIEVIDSKDTEALFIKSQRGFGLIDANEKSIKVHLYDEYGKVSKIETIKK